MTHAKSMKSISLVLVFTASLVLFAGCAAPTHVTEREEDREETLHILIDTARGPMSIDEEYLFTKAIEEVFEENDHAGPFIVRRSGRGAAPAQAPRLHLTIVEWRQIIPNQIDCRVSASLRLNGVRHDLGVARGDKTGLATALGPDQVNDIFRGAAAEAIRALYPRLAEHLPEPR